MILPTTETCHAEGRAESHHSPGQERQRNQRRRGVKQCKRPEEARRRSRKPRLEEVGPEALAGAAYWFPEGREGESKWRVDGCERGAGGGVAAAAAGTAAPRFSRTAENAAESARGVCGSPAHSSGMQTAGVFHPRPWVAAATRLQSPCRSEMCTHPLGSWISSERTSCSCGCVYPRRHPGEWAQLGGWLYRG